MPTTFASSPLLESSIFFAQRDMTSWPLFILGMHARMQISRAQFQSSRPGVPFLSEDRQPATIHPATLPFS